MTDQESTPKGQEPAGTDPKEGQEPQGDQPKTFGEDYVKTLRGEAAGYRTKNAELEEKLAEFENRDKSEVEKLSSSVEKLKSTNSDLASENLRLRVAFDRNLPRELVDRLKGKTQEELEADADELLKLVKPEAPAPELDQGVRQPAPTPESPEKAHAGILAQVLGRGPQSP